MYLLDSNIILEILLNQEKKDLCKQFISNHDPKDIFVSDLSLFSIGIILFKKKRYEQFESFIVDLVNKINMVSILIEEYSDLVVVSKNFNLDFDDSYQYTLAKSHDLQLVSFDQDFDRTDMQRLEPGKV